MREYKLAACLLFCWLRLSRASLKCAGGFGSTTKSRVISEDRINDGYCDCPLDAADETQTDACSGSTVGGWAGVGGTADRSPVFTCPQQPNKKLPLSRLNDGICDCCDGADEQSELCPDICEEVLAEERALKAKMEQDFYSGYAKRQEELEKFQQFVKETTLQMSKLNEELQQVNTEYESTNAQLDRLKLEYAKRRLETVQDIVSTAAMNLKEEAEASETRISGLLEPLTNEELSDFIVYSCQLAGEMEDAQMDDSSTCVPLRLAGLDVGLSWSKEDYLLGAAVEEMNNKLLADIMNHNIHHGDSCDPVWSAAGLEQQQRSNNNRRRLSYEDDEYDEDFNEYEDHDHDEYDHMYDEDYTGDEAPYGGDDDYVPPPTRDRYGGADRYQQKGQLSPAEEAKKKELTDQILESSFSKWRKAFLARAEEILAIPEASDNEGEEESGNETGEESGDDTAEDSTEASVDPMAINMIRNTLSRRKELIEKGLDYAASAKLLVDAVTVNQNADETRRQLVGLALMTLYHGKIGSRDVWQMLHATVPELAAGLSTDEESCGSPWSEMCPPRTVKREGAVLPPLAILREAESLCEEAAGETAAKLCASGEETDIPSEIPDGYYGYYLTRPRKDDDLLVGVFSSLETIDLNRSEIIELEGKIEETEEIRKSVERDLEKLDDDIGGKDRSKFGPNGELHFLRDECLEVEAGKYIYEVCVFGRAAQKEKDGRSSTSLGSWTGMEIDEETGDRMLKWEKGQRCWNGPERSATVHVMCGAETKVLSADEPDTCRYVLQMESPIACDDELKERLGL